MTQKPSRAGKVALLGMTGALAVALSFFEGLIPPVPMLPPGAKLGLSNIATMWAASSLGLGSALAVAVIKSGFVLLTRGTTAFFMSFAGGIASTFIMWLMFKFGKFGLVGVGIAGAVVHNAAQLAVSVILTGTPSLIYYSFALLVFALAAGSVTGVVLRIILTATEKIQRNGVI